MQTKMQQVADTYREPKSLCTCGHEGDGGGSPHEAFAGEAGHGKCKVPGCPCEHFVWTGWTRAFAMALARVRPS